MQPFTPRGRITSIHGVLLPPKKKLQGGRFISLRFVITGAIPSKKNMIWADSNLFKLLNKLYSFKVVKECVDWLRDNLKSYIRNSQKYVIWVEETTPAIVAQASVEIKKYESYGLLYPLSNVSVKVYHYWKDNVARDNSNKYDTIIDLFSSIGIITDDCWQVVRKNQSESECYHGEILDHITTVDITVRVS